LHQVGLTNHFTCSSVQPCTAEDGHNGARNMLSYWFINKS